MISLASPSFSFAQVVQPEYDLGVYAADIAFVPNTFKVGEAIRIYGRVENRGKKDMTAQVAFFMSQTQISQPQVVSSRAGGAVEEVFVDWVVPGQPFNVLLKILETTPEDQNAANNEAVSVTITPVKDSDGDGVADGKDNCPNSSNPAQTDSNSNGIGDVCEPPPPTPPAAPAPTTTSPTAPATNTPASINVNKPVVNSNTNAPLPPVANLNKNVNSLPGANAPASSGEPTDVSTGESISALETGGDQSGWNVFLDYQPLDWNRYKFSAIVNVSDGPEYTYEWDFGDNTRSTEQSVDHRFRAAGKYVVTLKVTDPSGQESSANTLIEISFFNWGNWKIKLIIGFLLGLAILLLILGVVAKEKLVRLVADKGEELAPEPLPKKFEPFAKKEASPVKAEAASAKKADEPEEKLQKYIDSIVAKKETKSVKDFNKKFEAAEKKLDDVEYNDLDDELKKIDENK